MKAWFYKHSAEIFCNVLVGISIVIGFVLSGCTVQEADHDFRFVGKWNDNEKTLITNAINDWGSDVVIDEKSNNTIVKADSLPGKTIAQIDFILNNNEESFRISYLNDLDEKRLKITTRHEIGHLLCHINKLKNCDIHLGKGNTMSADYKDIVNLITEDDYFYAYGN